MADFTRENGLEYVDVVRDVVRLAAIANMREQNFLNKDCVLVGGMALRLRGSSRFTIFDTDSSLRKPPVDKNSMAKHYVDLGWIGRELGHELNGGTIRRQLKKKLDTNRRLIPAFKKFEDISDLLPPLMEPEHYFGPLNKERNRRADSVRFVGNKMTLEEAKEPVQERIAPLLEERGDS